MQMRCSVEDKVLDHSKEVILSAQLPSGAYPASEAFSAYQGYSWFRDGSFIADAMSAVGEVESASAFFDWCANVIRKESGAITKAVQAAEVGDPLPDEEMLPTRFTFDGDRSDGTDGWWDFQLDGYGTWLWAVSEHSRRHGVDPARWKDAVRLTISYLVASWERPCFDWWEEHSEEVHISTLGCLVAGLRGARTLGLLSELESSEVQAVEEEICAKITTDGVVDGHLCKWVGNPEVDGSLSSLISPLKVVDANSILAQRTVEAVQRDLQNDVGVYRFRADVFFGGGRWPLLTAFLGLALLEQGHREDAEECLRWAIDCADEDGNLPEQNSDLLLHPDHYEEWVERWGEVAKPLLWSHAMTLRLASELETTEGLGSD